MAAASSTGRPAMRSATSRTFRGLMRMNFAVALTRIGPLLQRRRALAGPTGVAAEGPRRRELTEAVPDHVLADEDRHVATTVMDGDRVPDHLREDHARPRPRLEHLALAALVHVVDAAEQARVDEWSLLDGTTHLSAPNPAHTGGERSACWICSSWSGCAAPSQACPTWSSAASPWAAFPRHHRADGRGGSSPSRGRWGACPCGAPCRPSRSSGSRDRGCSPARWSPCIRSARDAPRPMEGGSWR